MLPRPQKPSCAVRVALFRYAPRVGLIRLSPSNRTLGHCLPNAVSVSPNMQPRRSMPSGGLGRRWELHPPAPVVAQRARLEALRFSVCSIPGWRPGLCWIGDPACLSAVWFAGGGLPSGSGRVLMTVSARPRGQATGVCARGAFAPPLPCCKSAVLALYRQRRAGQAQLGQKYFWNIITCGFAAPNHTTTARDRPLVVSWCAGVAIPKTFLTSEYP